MSLRHLAFLWSADTRPGQSGLVVKLGPGLAPTSFLFLRHEAASGGTGRYGPGRGLISTGRPAPEQWAGGGVQPGRYGRRAPGPVDVREPDELGRRGMRRRLEPALLSWSFPRKEVIQPHLPVRLPCYDFTPVTSPTFDGSLPKG